jgi:hypothetical protein
VNNSKPSYWSSLPKLAPLLIFSMKVVEVCLKAWRTILDLNAMDTGLLQRVIVRNQPSAKIVLVSRSWLW